MSENPLYAEARLQEIADLDLLSGDIDPILQRVAEESATHLGLPVSLVSVVLDDALHVAGSHGITGLWLDETKGHPLEWSFCATSVRTRAPYVVENAADDTTHAANPLVMNDGVRCYAGVPLISSRGFVLGNLCVVGMAPRSFTEAELRYLTDLASQAVARIEQRRVVTP